MVVLAWYTLVGTICVAPAIVIAQYYLETATADIVHLKNIEEIFNQPKAKYYTLENYYVDKSNAGIYSRETRPGQARSFDYCIYFVSPLLVSEADTNTEKKNIWLTKIYYKNFAGFDDADIQKRQDVFWKESMKDFDTLDIHSFQYISRSKNNSDLEGLEQAAKKSPQYSSEEVIQLFDANVEPFENRNGNKLPWFSFFFLTGYITFCTIFHFYTEYLMRENIEAKNYLAQFEKHKKKRV